jgi:hypothetical protein
MGYINLAKQAGDAMLHTAKQTGQGVVVGLAVGVALVPVFLLVSILDRK